LSDFVAVSWLWFFCAALIGPIASLKVAPFAVSDATARCELAMMQTIIAIRHRAKWGTTFMALLLQARSGAADISTLRTQLKGAGALI
jgi:hypothetical protein